MYEPLLSSPSFAVHLFICETWNILEESVFFIKKNLDDNTQMPDYISSLIFNLH